MSTIKTNQLAHTANGASVYTLPQTDGSAGQVLQTNGSGVLSWTTPSTGIIMADQWRRTAGVGTNGGENFLTTDWARVSTPMGTFGSGNAASKMTQSGGIFTFPTTGIYYVSWQAYAEVSSTSRMTAVNIYISSTDGTDFGNLASMISGVDADISGYSYSGGHCSALVDVTNVNNVKVKFRVYSSGNVTWDATSAENRNCATFIRLGDT
tara:strand:- start:12 stop:638 length:627 start_codon:yes stop_codon:yes gene_type:complete